VHTNPTTQMITCLQHGAYTCKKITSIFTQLKQRKQRMNNKGKKSINLSVVFVTFQHAMCAEHDTVTAFLSLGISF